MRIALLSVYDKTGIVEFARELVTLGFKIVSSRGTAHALTEAGVPTQDIAAFTGRAPILDHRVVTLAPEIHGGLLASEKHEAELKTLGIPRIDLVCVDLYPLHEAIAHPYATQESVLEKTDIGGVALLRSAAKGRRMVVTRPEDRTRVIEWLKKGEPMREEFLTLLAARAETEAAVYTLESAKYHSKEAVGGFIGSPKFRTRAENVWQGGAQFYSTVHTDPLALNHFQIIEGAGASYNNWTDVDRTLQTITHIAAGFEKNFNRTPKIAVGVKHGNTCGTAVGENTITVLQNMLAGDPLAIFGGFIMTNFPITSREAECLRTWGMPDATRRLLDGIAAPSFTKESKAILARKNGKCRLFQNKALASLSEKSLDYTERIRYARGGFLRQKNYTFVLSLGDTELEYIGDRKKVKKEDTVLAWAIGTTSNSNTVTIVKNYMLIGNGVGQQDRVSAARLAIERARRSGHLIEDAVAYSDSFFPFIDGPQTLIDAGVKTIFASSGSVRDTEVKEYCRSHNVSLLLIPDTKGRGFFGH